MKYLLYAGAPVLGPRNTKVSKTNKVLARGNLTVW